LTADLLRFTSDICEEPPDATADTTTPASEEEEEQHEHEHRLNVDHTERFGNVGFENVRFVDWFTYTNRDYR
jgi:hypothetical protein